MTDIARFIWDLASIPYLANVTNQYCWHVDPLINNANAVRRRNLKLYLTDMVGMDPDTILIGEAPGYRGCRITGIPFTSEAILPKGQPHGLNLSGPSYLLGRSSGYQSAPDSAGITREASSTIFWQGISLLDRIPLLWNAFPLHPHQPDQQWSNRSPTRSEMLLGERFIRVLVGIFPITRFVAVGKIAAKCMEDLGCDPIIIRHPSFGGKDEFLEGIRRLTSDRDLPQMAS